MCTAIFLLGVGGTDASSKGYNRNDPSFKQFGHSVVDPSGCIVMIDVSGIQPNQFLDAALKCPAFPTSFPPDIISNPSHSPPPFKNSTISGLVVR